MWLGVGCPCPPVRNDIVTPCHLLFSVLVLSSLGLFSAHSTTVRVNPDMVHWFKILFFFIAFLKKLPILGINAK